MAKYRVSDVKVDGLHENRCVETCILSPTPLTAQFHLTATKMILILGNFNRHSLRHDVRVALQWQLFNFRQKLLQGKRTHGLYDARGPAVLKIKLLTMFNNHCKFR